MNEETQFCALNTPIYEPSLLEPHVDIDHGDNDNTMISQFMIDQTHIGDTLVPQDLVPLEPSYQQNDVPAEIKVSELEIENDSQQNGQLEDNEDDNEEDDEPLIKKKKKNEESPKKDKPKKKYVYNKDTPRHYCQEENCTYSSDCAERLSRHVRRAHRGLQPYACSMCDYATVNSQMMREHMFRHTGEKPYKCSICDHRSASKKNIKMHEKKHDPSNPNRCPCGFIGRGLASVRHARICSVINASITLKKLKCKVCKYETTDDQLMRKHRSSHRLKCNKCGYTSLELAKMQLHHLQCMTADVVKGVFKCKVCAWTSKVPQKILLHLIHHPKQEVDENIVDVTVLKNFGIMD